jgi:hypothetical protein
MKQPIFLILALCASMTVAGCLKDQVTDFSPKEGPVCTPVKITGQIYPGSEINGVWFEENRDPTASLQQLTPVTPGSFGNDQILATVPRNTPQGTSIINVNLSSGGYLLIQGTTHLFNPGFTVRGVPSTPVISNFGLTTSPLIRAGTGESASLAWSVAPPVTSIQLVGTNSSGQIVFVANETGTFAIVHPTDITSYVLKTANLCITQQSAPVKVTVVKQLKLTLSPSTIVAPTGTVAQITATTTPDNVPVNISCSTTVNGIACPNPLTLNPPSTITDTDIQTTFPITIGSTAPYGPQNVTVAAKETSGTTPWESTAPISIVVGRQTGPFALITGMVQAIGTTPVGSCTAKIQSAGINGGYPQFAAIFQCPGTVGGQSVDFTVAPPFPAIEGVGYSSNGNEAVVGSHQLPGAAFLVYSVVKLPSLKVVPVPAAYDSTSSDPAPPASLTPEFWLSPDGTIAMVVGLSTNSGGPPRQLNVYDLVHPGTPIGPGIAFSGSATAEVVSKGTSPCVSLPQCVVVTANGTKTAFPYNP